MSNKPSDVEIEDEVAVVRVLSALFITFMVLIVSSYSEVAETELVNSGTLTTVSHTQQSTSPDNQSSSLLQTRLKAGSIK